VFNGDAIVKTYNITYPTDLPMLYCLEQAHCVYPVPWYKYIASLGECCLLLAFSPLINLLQLPVLVFLSQWVKPTMVHWCSLNYSVAGFQVFSRSLLRPVLFAPVSYCCSSNWVRDSSHTSHDCFENLVS